MPAEQRVSGPPGYPLIGDWWHFARDRLAFLSDCYRRYGETTRLRIVVPTFLIHNPDDIHHVLVAREENYRKSRRVIGRAGRRMFAHALLTKRGGAHTEQRRLVQPVFHRHAVVVFAAAIQSHVEGLLDSWTGIVDLTEELDRFAEHVLLQALAGELEVSTRQRLSEANRARRRFINRAFRMQFPLPHWLPTRWNWEYRRADQLQRKILLELVRRARRGELEPRSLLAQMAAGDRLGDEDLVEEVGELLTAGYETTREALTWSSYLLARHPEGAARLRAEVRQVAGAGPVRVEDVPRLAYADMFFSEALRLFPPAWMFVRVALAGDVLPSGVRVPAGAKIYLCPYTAHRNAEFFPDPERFDPDRFEPERRSRRPRFSYFPFGGGDRVCVAEALVRLEGVLVLASLARRFHLELCPGQSIAPVGAVTLRPGGAIRVAVRPAAAP